MNCCDKKIEKRKKGFWTGIFYGLIPHTFCIGFIVFTVLGVTIATAFLRPFLMNRYFFHILIGLSFVFATVSAIIYLKKNVVLSFSGIKRAKKYLAILYGTTISINLLLFLVIFPIMTNINSGTDIKTALLNTFQWQGNVGVKQGPGFLSIKVDIPCSGHAPLIVGGLRGINGVENIEYRFPNFFDIDYDFEQTNQEEILSLEIFNIYQATVIYR